MMMMLSLDWLDCIVCHFTFWRGRGRALVLQLDCGSAAGRAVGKVGRGVVACHAERLAFWGRAQLVGVGKGCRTRRTDGRLR